MAPTRVALDGRWLQQPTRGGVGRSIANLLPLMTGEVDLHLLLRSDWPQLEQGLETGLETTYLKSAVASATWWLQVPAVRSLRGFDGIFHTPWYGLPFLQPVPMVVTIHDLVCETHPEWFDRGRQLPYQVQGRWAARTARKVLTVSETVKAEIIAHPKYRVSPDDVVVAPHGIDPAFHPDADPTLRQRLLPAAIHDRYVVALGGAHRRQPDVAIAAWRDVVDSGVEVGLVVMGGDPPAATPGLCHVGNLSDAEWASVLAGADAFVYPTLDEGYGMPATESLGSGTPVVCARVGALPEVLDDCAQWASAPNALAIAVALGDLLADDRARLDLRQRGLDRAATLTWDLAARRTVEAYRAAAG